MASATPAVARAERFAFEARQKAIVPFREAQGGAIALRAHDEVFLSFDLSVLPKRPVVEAYVLLLLDEVDLSQGPGSFVAAPIVEAWSTETARWKQPHRAGSSSALSLLTNVGRQLIRVDVRAEIQAAMRDPDPFEGVALAYSGSARAKLGWEDSENSWRTPQLEVYVESEKSPQRPTASGVTSSWYE